ncbi:hypothetical protein [Bacteroides pyogenes]|uniref:HIRAN domain-containing protein n=1 Tax=Bacteroides pyogenes TaxID=310300 RepID=A0A5D3FQ20_9BACE|nr:hypothetical protein [Bacteroides pyogenes]MCI7070647.1 hypothetical protein [Bacteroides pyogenes]TYK32888.1 hypothetical protein FNJ60_10120 [Bacteroides pyogenes]TYK50016.1 hypothetical protein FNG97_04975 [Bacteroides pyogenes]
MGSTGSGNFSDYKNFSKARKGVTGSEDSIDKCALAFSTLVEDVDACDFYIKNGKLPTVGDIVSVEFNVRLIVTAEDGTIIGYLPTEYNYLRNCIAKGFTYFGRVSVVGTTPINTVVVDIIPNDAYV